MPIASMHFKVSFANRWHASSENRAGVTSSPPVASSSALTPEKGARAAFRYPSFRLWMIARFLVTASSEMQAVAVGWQIYAVTHRPLDLGLAGLAQFLPGVLLFLVEIGRASCRERG